MKFDRLFGILTMLLQNDRVTAPQLAEKFEVSRRTIGRDIITLCAAGIPIITYQGVGGGIGIAEGFKLDKRLLTTDELTEIIAAIKGIGTVSEPLRIERTLDKFGANSVVSLREPIVIDLASYYRNQLTEKIGLIKDAVIQGKVIEFDYYYEKGESRRRIEPYVVIFQWTSWYVYGFCLERQDWRMFKLTRLWGLNMLNETFAAREMPPPVFGSHFSDQIRLVALFDSSVKYQLIDSYGLGCYTETNDGLLFEFGFTNRGFLVSWLLSFGGNVKVLEPADIADEVRTTAEKIVINYDKK